MGKNFRSCRSTKETGAQRDGRKCNPFDHSRYGFLGGDGRILTGRQLPLLATLRIIRRLVTVDVFVIVSEGERSSQT